MKAIVIATNNSPALAALNEQYPAAMAPMVDRPFIQHVIEYLVAGGVTEVDVILSHLPKKIEDLHGDGREWGIKINYHLRRDEQTPYVKLQTILETCKDDEFFLLAHADRLPQAQLTDATQATMFYEPDGSTWTGWAWLAKATVSWLPKEADEEALEAHLAQVERCARQTAPVSLSVRSYEEIFASQQKVLGGEFAVMQLHGRETSPGVWLARNVTLHPTVKLTAPVFIGENCRVGRGVELGPNVVVGSDCVLDARTTAQHSLVFSGTYLGENLELNEAIVDKNRLINAREGVAVLVTDDWILGNLEVNRLFASARRWSSRLLAMMILLLASPLLLLTVIWLRLARRGALLHKHYAVRLPAASDPRSWRQVELWSFLAEQQAGDERGLSDLPLRFLPGLMQVARGKLAFVGMPPLPAHEVMALTHDWQMLYLSSKVGLVTEAFVAHGARPTADEQFSADAYYSAVANWRYDVKVVARYLARLVKTSFVGSARDRQAKAERAAKARKPSRKPLEPAVTSEVAYVKH